jgi:hypothetical protein
MKITMNKPTSVNARFVKFNIPVRTDAFGFWEDDVETIKNNLNCPKADFTNDMNQFTIDGVVDIDTGKFISWTPTKHEVEIFEKVVDEGVYSMFDDDFVQILLYDGYVPSIFECNENGYGDYFNMTILPDGTIKNWDENMSSKIKDFMGKAEIYG